MLNLVMTHSPRLAAMSTNKPLGEDVVKDPAYLHRIAWSRLGREKRQAVPSPAIEPAYRERTA
ncbi:MAG: hypothetical protein ABI577_03600 [bacterium]